jgi:hypothetical protein
MKTVDIEGKEFSPRVYLDAEKGLIEISGNSYHEYTYEFYDPIFEWVEALLKREGRKITANFKMSYFNTASSKCLYDLIEMLKEYDMSGKGIIAVNWMYRESDEDMLETGHDYLKESGWNKINLVPYK